jgi:hypothetical protein
MTDHEEEEEEEEEPKTETTTTTRRGITFNQKIGVALIMSLEEFTPEECKLAWFQAEEYTQMEAECEFTSEFLQNKKMLPPALCGRGLECWTLEGEKVKDKNISMAVELVWQAQLAQWTDKEKEASTSDVFIAQEYEQVTVPCHAAAHMVGLNDEKEVKRYLAPIKNMEKTRQKMQSLLAKNHKHANITSNVPVLKPAISTSNKIKTPKTTAASRKVASAAASTSGSNSIAASLSGTKKKGGLDLLDKIERRIAEGPALRIGSKSLSQINSSGVAPSSPTRSVKSARSARSARKIDFRTKGKTGVPLSPAGSVHSSGEFSSGSRRHFSSHQSVCSSDGDEGSIRRRMLKATSSLQL